MPLRVRLIAIRLSAVGQPGRRQCAGERLIQYKLSCAPLWAWAP